MLRRRGESLVAADLLLRAALVNRRQGEKAGEAGCGGSAINPGKLERGEREGEVFRTDNETAFLRLHEGGSDAGAIKGFHHFALGSGPLVRVAFPGGDQARYGSARDIARRLNEHLQIKAVGETPQNLPHRIAGEGEHGFGFR